MTLPLSPDALPLVPATTVRGEATDDRDVRELSVSASRPKHTARDAAQQFEGLIMRELMKVLRKTIPEGTLGGSGFAGNMYTEMMDDALADEIAKGSGLGMRDMLEQSLGGGEHGGAPLRTALGDHDRAAALVGTVRRPLGYPSALPRAYTEGAQGRLHGAAAELLADGAEERWSRDGQLLPQDLASDFSTATPGGEARFNVRDANGYQGYYKCNLFAFELARRAGFQVPVVGRARGWGYPAPNAVTADAADGAVEEDWARVASAEHAETMDQDLRAGRRAFLLTGSATGERAGHMAVVDRIHEVQRGPDGRVRRIVFDGWEARSRGAQHLVRRTWNLAGHPGGTLARNGFSQIEVLEMRPVTAGANPERPTSRGAGGSLLDKSSQGEAGVVR